MRSEHAVPSDIDPTTGIIYERPPVTFAEAEAHNAYTLLTELALSAAVVAWWFCWQAIMVHRAMGPA